METCQIEPSRGSSNCQRRPRCDVLAHCRVICEVEEKIGIHISNPKYVSVICCQSQAWSVGNLGRLIRDLCGGPGRNWVVHTWRLPAGPEMVDGLGMT